MKNASKNETADLVLRLTAERRAEIGYGTVYICDVKEVVQGTLPAGPVRMTMLASDRANEAFFEAHKPPAVMEVGFRKDHEHEPDPLALLTGFVDGNQTAWRLLYAR